MTDRRKFICILSLFIFKLYITTKLNRAKISFCIELFAKKKQDSKNICWWQVWKK